MAKAKRAKQVHEYFVEKLGNHPRIREWRGVDIPVNTTCGADCVQAIDAGASVIFHMRRAAGENQHMEQPIIDAVEQVCGIYILG